MRKYRLWRRYHRVTLRRPHHAVTLDMIRYLLHLLIWHCLYFETYQRIPGLLINLRGVLVALPQPALYVALGHLDYLLNVPRVLPRPQWRAGTASEILQLRSDLGLDHVEGGLLTF